MTSNKPNYEAFAREIFTEIFTFEHTELEGDYLQDVAQRHNVLIETRPTKKCGDNCACVSTGFPTICMRLPKKPWYRRIF